MLSFNVLITICLAYVVLLFAVAFWADKRAEGGQVGAHAGPGHVLQPQDGARIHGPGEVQLLRLESRLRLMGLHELDSKRGSNGLRINVRRLTKKAES